ncbi:DUF4159 domain-containing protein [Candidatus Palauibacter sp.]|uniref:DUF4159 domain-containing protein n=1 Tax=Candidatus Palauibacter sp. TaxID=3101350 RepID=UPI003AF2CECA
MKPCRRCRRRVPDATRACPHCRASQPRGERLPQTVLGLAAVAAATLAAIGSCPGLKAQQPVARAPLHSSGDPSRVNASLIVATRQEPPTIARLRYDGGGDWYANPSSLDNLLEQIELRTGIDVADRPAEVGAADPDLADHPYLYATGHGNMSFTSLEIERLRAYLYGGGFLHVDDNYGLDESFRREVARLFPDMPLAEVPLEHAIYRVFYDFAEGLPKIHEHDGDPAQGFGIFIDGRLAVYYSFESDLGDGWEDEGVHGDAPEIREQALRMGVNLFLYALSAMPTR